MENFLNNVYVKILIILQRLPYRQKVSGVVFDNDKNFLIVQPESYGKNQWNFSGGGINKKETPRKAMLRELKEELGSTNFKILKQSKITIKYDWPNSLVINKLKESNKTWRGQEVSYLFVRFTGKKETLKPALGEIRKIKWIKKEGFKKHFIFPNQQEEVDMVFKDFNI